MKRPLILILTLFICSELFALSDTQLSLLSMKKTEEIFAYDTEIGRIPQQQDPSEEIGQLLEDFFLKDFTEEERSLYLHEDTRLMVKVLYGQELFSLLPAKDLRLGIAVNTEGMRIPFRLFLDEFSESESMTGMVFLIEAENGWKIAHIEINIS